MKLNIDKNLPVSIKDQLKKQIRGMIQSGVLTSGHSLPSSADLSRILSINKNTVAAVYSELCAEGFLKSNRGAGTFVAEGLKLRSTADLRMLFDEAFIQAKKMGYSSDEITDQFFNTLAHQPRYDKKTILLVWCNQYTIEELSQTLESTLDVRTKGLLVQDIDQNPDIIRELLKDIDLVVTSVNYIERILPYVEEANVDAACIMLTPVTRILNELIKVPSGTKIGFTCVNKLAAESACKCVHLSGNITLNTIWAGADDHERLKEMLSQCEVIFATHHVYDQVVKAVDKDKRVVWVDASIPETSIDLIREKLEKQQNL